MKPRIRTRHGLFALALALAPASARAQSADPAAMAAAQSLFDQAVEEMAQKNYTSACPKLEQTTKLLPEAIGAKETLAQCYEAQGRLASAWAQYGLVESLASRSGQQKRADEAAKKAAALKPKLAKLTVEVPAGARGLAGLAITRDGISIGEALFGAALPVDRGEHVVEARAQGYRAFSKTIRIEADGAEERVTVPALEKEEAPPSAEPPPPNPTPKPAPAPARPWQRPLGIATTLAGAGLLAASGVFLGLALGKNNESNADNHCDAQNKCDSVGLGLRSRAVELGNGATATLIAGSVLAAGGLVLWITAPSRREENAKAAGGRWSVDLSPTGLGVSGVF